MNPPTECPECENGTIQSVTEDYTLRTTDGHVITVPRVELHRCDSCGLLLVPASSSRYISEYEARESEQLTREELHAIFERSDLTQKDFAEALGLGEKTFHRWLKGTQVVSRSMGYYLRAMDRFPEAFDWVKTRGWRKPPHSSPCQPIRHVEARFPALERRTASATRETVNSIQFNPARALVLEAVHLTSN